jgi:hypothetical protein
MMEADQPWGFDPQHAGGWRIVLADPAVARERDRPDGAVELDQRPVGPRRVLTLPHPHEPPMRGIFERHEDRLWDLVDRWRGLASIEQPDHQIGGWPCLVQNPLQTECQLASNGIHCGSGDAYRDPGHEEIRRGALGWRLLLQVDTDDATGWVWGDFGSLYSCIKGDTVDAATLDAAWAILQCG